MAAESLLVISHTFLFICWRDISKGQKKVPTEESVESSGNIWNTAQRKGKSGLLTSLWELNLLFLSPKPG